RSQLMNQARQGLDRLRAVASAIVQQNDLASQVRVGTGDARDRALDNRVRARQSPVVRVYAQTYSQIAQTLGARHRLDLIRRRWLGVAEIRGAKQPRRPAGERFDQSLRRVQFEVGQAAGDFAQVRVRERVIADLVALGDDAFDEVGVGLPVLTDDEE